MSERIEFQGQPMLPNPETPIPNWVPSADVYISSLEAKGKNDIADTYRAVIKAAQVIKDQGGRALLVGGCVRDMAVGTDPKDFDIEVYGLEEAQLEEIAQTFGKVDVVGKKFGITTVSFGNGINLDLALPRKDSKTGIGHKDFDAKIDPNMTIFQACKRRDFTMNSMAGDPLTGELYDPFNGLADIQARTLRVTDPILFGDDALRVLRGVQFAGRFSLTVDPESIKIMQAMVPELTTISKERFLSEWRKLLIKSEKPSIGLQLGMELGIFDMLYPDFPPLKNTPQEPEFHPEGDAWTHTLMVTDQAAKIAKREHLSEDSTMVLMLTALTHDLGKSTSTATNEDGRITANGHESASIEPAKRFLTSIGVYKDTAEKVLKLVKQHMWPHQAFYTESVQGEMISNGAIRKLAARLYPATINELALMAEADHTGRGFFLDEARNELILPNEFAEGDWLRKRAADLDVQVAKPANIIEGKDLISQFKLKPGKEFNTIISYCNKLRDICEYTRDELLRALDGVEHSGHAIERLTDMLAFTFAVNEDE